MRRLVIFGVHAEAEECCGAAALLASSSRRGPGARRAQRRPSGVTYHLHLEQGISTQLFYHIVKKPQYAHELKACYHKDTILISETEKETSGHVNY